jgi:cell wall assembly regulator SMI1
MTPLDALRELQARKLVTVEHGEACDAELLPAMSWEEIDALEEQLGAPIPHAIRELMANAGGVEVDCDELSWNGRAFGQEVRDAFPCSMPLLDDGAGNSWSVDIDRQTGAWGPVYFVCHDPAVVVRQADSLAQFIVQFADDCCQPEREGSLSRMSQRLVNKVWDSGGVTIDAMSLRISSDDILRRAGESVEEGVVCDLRRGKMGDGFAWGLYGPRTIISRPGPEPVFVLRRPAGAKKWWRRLG